jgi:transposase InsO family protein/transposase-like protein
MSAFKQGKTGTSSKAYPILGRIRGLRRLLKMLKSLNRFNVSEIAQERLRIIEFYDKHGEASTYEAFKVDRKLIYVWRRKLKKQQGKLSSLIPFSTTPTHSRQMQTNPLIVEEIKRLREQYYRLGKDKIKPLLDEYCMENNVKSISSSTIGKIIKRKQFFFQRQDHIYHNPNHKHNSLSSLRTKRLRVKHPPSHLDFGHIQSDTVERIVDGIKEYFYNAIDTKMKFTLSINYPKLNSRNNKDFYQKFKEVYPGDIKDWQTDNGLENLGEFEEELSKENIPHFFTYPRCPKINGIIERYNRTFQEEFLNQNLHILHDKILFNQKLSDYLIFYNTKRVHKSLDLKSPMDYFIQKGQMSKMSMTYTHN